MRGPGGKADGGRQGATLLELAVALVVAGLFTLGVAALLRAAGEATRSVVERTDDQQTVRTVWSVLEEELSAGRPGVDWWVEEPAAIRLRAFRGVGLVCGPSDGGSGGEGAGEGGGEAEWAVLWFDQRAPVPGSDSVLVWGTDGRWHGGVLEGAGIASDDGTASDGAGPAASLCSGGGALPDPPPRLAHLRWTGGPSSEGWRPLVVRTFVPGRYSLEDGAFRYLRGAAGRQPLTPERVEEESRIRPVGESPAGAEFELHLRGGAVYLWRHGGVHP